MINFTNDFILRGFYKSLDFLQKVKINIPPSSVSFSQSDILYTVNLNLKEYYNIYQTLLCKESGKYLEEVYFCKCCSNLTNYQRNYGLYLSRRGKITKTNNLNDTNINNLNDTNINNLNDTNINNLEVTNINNLDVTNITTYITSNITNISSENDTYILYLKGLINQDINILYEVIKINPYLWEAYLAIIDLSTPYNIQEVDRPLSDYFYMTLFVKKQIQYKYNIKNTYQNLEGAVYYYKRDYKKAESIFKKCINIDYLDLYSNILYINKDPRLFDLTQKLIKLNKYRPETICSIANTYSSKTGDIKHKSIEYYTLCTQLRPCSMYYTLLGHEYLDLKDHKKAIEAYTESIKICAEDYRGWYSLGKVYEVLNMPETALFYYKKAVEYKKDDTLVWLSLGNIYIMTGEFEDGLRCFRQSAKLKDPLGYLYIAETYKTMNMYSESAEYYEKYVNESEKDADVIKICVFLEEYYRKMCDNEKSKKYYEMSRDN